MNGDPDSETGSGPPRCDSEAAAQTHGRCDSEGAAHNHARCDGEGAAVSRCDAEGAVQTHGRCDSEGAAHNHARRDQIAVGGAHAQKIEDLDAVRQYIDQIDFSMLKAKLTAPVSDEGFGWSSDEADRAEARYKRWLFLRRKYDGELMPPTQVIDAFWHAHILDTMAYHRDTAAIFGRYLHHYPYFGMRGEDDYNDLVNAFDNTKRRYLEEYGEDVTRPAEGAE